MPMIDQLLKGPDPFQISDLRRVVSACEQLEAAWKEGRRFRIESFLENIGSSGRPWVLRELLALEVELRLERGERPTPREYLDRFPRDAQAVEAAFRTIGVDPSSSGARSSTTVVPGP